MSALEIDHVTVFQSGVDEYVAYRIPAVETAPDGTLLAFAEARKRNLGDPGHEGQEIDLVLRRSSDGGVTWSRMQVIEAPGDFWSAANPATVVDRDRGRIWLMYVRCRPGAGSGVARPRTDDVRNLARTSDDNGRTWSEPIDLTEVFRDLHDDRWRCTIPGPGGAVQDRGGRLVFPCWKCEPRENFAVISTDHGRTWKRSDFVPGSVHGNENQLVVLSDGHLLMDIRQSEGEHRWFTRSDDGGTTWTAPRVGIAVSPVACAIKRVPLLFGGRKQEGVLWTGPGGPGRRNLIARVSRDDGLTFDGPRLICASMAAYSDLTVLEDGTAGVLWEKGKESPYETLTFTVLPTGSLV